MQSYSKSLLLGLQVIFHLKVKYFYSNFQLPNRTSKFIVSLAENGILLALDNRTTVNVDPCIVM